MRVVQLKFRQNLRWMRHWKALFHGKVRQACRAKARRTFEPLQAEESETGRGRYKERLKLWAGPEFHESPRGLRADGDLVKFGPVAIRVDSQRGTGLDFT